MYLSKFSYNKQKLIFLRKLSGGEGILEVGWDKREIQLDGEPSLY